MNAVLSYLLQMLLPALMGAVFWGCTRPLRKALLARHGQSPGPCREGALLLFFMFVAGLLALTLTPAGFWPAILSGRLPPSPQPLQGGVNLMPIRESRLLLQYYLQNHMWNAILVNFPGNIVMFLPIGFFAGLFMDKPRWWKSTLATFALSLFIEVFQLFVARGTDVDDLILNTLGGLLGHGCFLLLSRADPGLVRRCAKRWKGGS